MYPRNNQPNHTISGAKSRTLSSFMSSVYLWMVAGIAISGATAQYVASRADILAYLMQHSGIFIGLIVAQLVAVVALSGWVQKMSVTVAATVYILYAVSVGITFSILLQMYTAESISNAFFVTAFSFAGLSAFGFITKRDLGPIGSFCIMGLFGMIGMIVLGFFIPSLMSNTMQLTISAMGVIIFAGLTAYDTQRIKAMQYQFTNTGQAQKGAIFGALILYLDFINLFLSLLRLMGNRR